MSPRPVDSGSFGHLAAGADDGGPSPPGINGLRALRTGALAERSRRESGPIETARCRTAPAMTVARSEAVCPGVRGLPRCDCGRVSPASRSRFVARSTSAQRSRRPIALTRRVPGAWQERGPSRTSGGRTEQAAGRRQSSLLSTARRNWGPWTVQPQARRLSSPRHCGDRRAASRTRAEPRCPVRGWSRLDAGDDR